MTLTAICCVPGMLARTWAILPCGGPEAGIGIPATSLPRTCAVLRRRCGSWRSFRGFVLSGTPNPSGCFVFESTLLSKRSFQGCRLYVIVDRVAGGGRDPLHIAEAAIRGGADCIQWRDKHSSDAEFLGVARSLRRLTLQESVLFVVNDRVSVAQLAQADAVHLGHLDLPLAEARQLVGDSMAIGRSTHSLKEALEAQAQGADYIGVGPIFATPTKPDTPAVGPELIRKVAEAIRVPWVAIGGIDLSNLPLVLSAGALRVAVVRAVAAASDPEAAARLFKSQLLP